MAEATVADLSRVPENARAELVHGEIRLLPPSGGVPAYARGEVFVSLHDYARQTRRGYAFTATVAFLVQLPHRRSFSPDVSFHPGPLQGGQFPNGAPVFAIEMRGENDYGAQAERDMADKRADYFATGTEVVWDVDVLRDEEVRKYTAADSGNPTVFRRGDTADAEPALPDWRFAVDDIFPSS